jgi:hypothetical protein
MATDQNMKLEVGFLARRTAAGEILPIIGPYSEG